MQSLLPRYNSTTVIIILTNAHDGYETKLTLKIRSLVLTWELADDNPEHIDFWRITITKVAVYVVRFPHPLAAEDPQASMSVERAWPLFMVI